MILSLSLGLMVSCNETPEQSGSDKNSKSLEDSVAEYNHQVVKDEIQEIDDFIRRYRWEMKQTQTGLRYFIYHPGNGPEAKVGDNVAIKYKVTLLNGDLVFRSDTAALFTFEIGKRNVISGLEEGVMLMKNGSRAKLIVPSHLAFGLLGDLEKIPARAVLVYDVELCKIYHSKK
jgi:FKBP-type peptidyl-prolyl cis-trans isomerase FkpA